MLRLRTCIFLGLCVGVDHISKLWAMHSLIRGVSVPVMPGLQWTLALNRGIAWSHFHSVGIMGNRVLVGAIMLLTLMVGWLVFTQSLSRIERAGFSLVLAGALGNLWDRLQWGAVVDFIEVFYKDWYWPVFNIADSLICIGMACLVVSLCKGEGKHA